MISKNIKFLKINNSELHVKLLYDFLDKRTHNISHIKMPEFKEHEKLVKQNPYKFWYFIETNKKLVGTFYIKYDNYIGLNLIEYSKDLLVPEGLDVSSISCSERCNLIKLPFLSFL